MARTSKYAVAQPATFATQWKAGLYIRLSREDGDKMESESVLSQKAQLENFILEHNDIVVFDTYIDDGWSGTDFDRPSFKRLFEDLTTKKINCVIVKDLSRFGRNYVEAGKYLEVIFPLLKIRFIAINDNIDSYDNPSSINNVIVPFKNIMNDEYCRDISTKVRSSLDIRRKQGKFIGSFAAYGYKKDENDHNKLVVDDEAAEVVRQIFDYFLDGYSIIGIARLLNEKGVPNPTHYKKSKGLHSSHSLLTGSGLWCDATIRRILTNEVYIGNLVQKKNEVVSYKVHVSKAVERSGWIVVRNTHEAIIKDEQFSKVQELLKRDTRTSPKTKQLSVFAGFVKCPDCGRAMQKRRVTQPYKIYDYYACATYRKMHSGACTKHTIRSDILEEAVLTFLNKMIAIAVDSEKILKRVNEAAEGSGKSQRILAVKMAKEKEIASAKHILNDLYPDYKQGLLSLEQYKAMHEKYQNVISKAEDAIIALEKESDAIQSGVNESNEFIATFKKYHGLNRLTRDVMVELVENIYIHEGGAVELHLKCKDAFLQVMECVAQNEQAN